nr:unnamed protein product [Spirometra erinaceieuropaei]
METAELEQEGQTQDNHVYTYPLVKCSDMPEEMRSEVVEYCVTACEKYPADNRSAAQCLKDELDKKCGTTWHVVVGEGYGFEVTYELNSLLYMYFGGNLGILAWKC